MIESVAGGNLVGSDILPFGLLKAFIMTLIPMPAMAAVALMSGLLWVLEVRITTRQQADIVYGPFHLYLYLQRLFTLFT